MNDVKEKLFKATYNNAIHYLKLKRIMPDHQIDVVITHQRFSALYEVIEACGLEEEYQKWKEEVMGEYDKAD